MAKTKRPPKVERCIRAVKKTPAAKAGRVNPFAVCYGAANKKNAKKEREG